MHRDDQNENSKTYRDIKKLEGLEEIKKNFRCT